MGDRASQSSMGNSSGPLRGQAGKKLAGRLFARMLAAAGPRHWWPCDPNSPNDGADQCIIGAVLTQNTAWKNVEQALSNLKAAGLCRLANLAVLAPEAIALLIRPSGYFNLKARRLLAVARFFAPAGGERFAELRRWPDEKLREALLAIWGVGPETADSILLYALGRPSFVIDAYTLRIGRRHGLFDGKTTYEEARAWFSAHVPADVPHYNEYHALLVWIGNLYCKPTPRCEDCPLAGKDCTRTPEAWQFIQDRLKSTQSA